MRLKSRDIATAGGPWPRPWVTYEWREGARRDVLAWSETTACAGLLSAVVVRLCCLVTLKRPSGTKDRYLNQCSESLVE